MTAGFVISLATAIALGRWLHSIERSLDRIRRAQESELQVLIEIGKVLEKRR